MSNNVQSYSSNTNKPHSLKRVFSRQSYTTIVHHPQTSGSVPAAQRTQSGGAARLSRTHTLDADQFGISRDPTRQTHARNGVWPGHLTPKRSSLLYQIRYGTEDSERTDSANNTGNTARPQGRGVHHHPVMARTTREALERPLGGVGQDKDRNYCDRMEILQPAVVNKFTPSQATSRESARLKKESGDNRRSVPVQVWVHPIVKEELSRLAAKDDLSLSSAGASLLTRALQSNIDMQYGALLKPVIEATIAKEMRGIATRLSWLLVRIAFDAGQTRSLVTNILGRQQGVTQPLLKTILESSGKSAKANIMRRTPQIASLIDAVEQWIAEENRGERHKQNV